MKNHSLQFPPVTIIPEGDPPIENTFEIDGDLGIVPIGSTDMVPSPGFVINAWLRLLSNAME